VISAHTPPFLKLFTLQPAEIDQMLEVTADGLLTAAKTFSQLFTRLPDPFDAVVHHATSQA
jgi:hypothetical protein